MRLKMRRKDENIFLKNELPCQYISTTTSGNALIYNELNYFTKSVGSLFRKKIFRPCEIPNHDKI